MAMTRIYNVGDQVTPLSKTMTQEAINLFEKSGGKTGPSQFTDEETARETLGTRGTVASGRMSLTFATEMLRRYFGSEIYNRGGHGGIAIPAAGAPGRHRDLHWQRHRHHEGDEWRPRGRGCHRQPTRRAMSPQWAPAPASCPAGCVPAEE